ncbi:DUF4189 domain-containing protein [Xanthomonas euvesicatoria pv. physalidis]|uniref:DUF4189 domain-containing protein n=1 Tax=Xanthomonas euvesicatoria TaxID=456327 RepID=UPI001C487724|nr:DUF4189 domain-containing protein [Xanthomonas euvesicatoria]MBV6690379.1 DUF4189 domain-containing protein [Xanthomonas euvesicatoria pv. physalidis]MBV6795954.1 DUF4189 domain-containing protein [Xanthomonas campestris pv. daturae]
MRLCVLLVFPILYLPITAWAQGCPPGQYQIGGQGAIACAPIPQGSPQETAPAPRPLGKWIKTWGAIAIGWVGPIPYYGVPIGKLSKSDAESDALERCAKKGPKNCEIKLTYFNQCSAIAEPQTVENLIPDGSTTVFVGNASLDGAANQAAEECKAKNKNFDVGCKVICNACSNQLFEKY